MFFSFIVAMFVRKNIFGISPENYAFIGIGIMFGVICLLLITLALSSGTKQ